MTPDRNLPIPRAVGRFFGHLVRAVRSDPKRDKTELRRTVDERTAAGPAGERVTMRRTTIEEVEVERPGNTP